MTRKVRLADRLLAGFVLAGVLVFLGPAAATADVLYMASTNVRVIDSASGARLAEIPIDRFVFDIRFNADGSRAYLAVADGVIEVDATEHTVLGQLTEGPAFRLDMTTDGRYLHILGNRVRTLSGGQQEALPSEITVYDLTERRVVGSHEVGLRAEEFVILGDRVAVSMPLDYTIAQVSTADGSALTSTPLRFQPEGDQVPGFLYGMALAGDRIYLAQAASQVVIHAISTTTGERVALPFDHQGFVTGVRASADGGTLYVSTRNHLAVLNAATGEERAWIALGGAHYGMALGNEGRYSYHTIGVVDEAGGAVTVVSLERAEVERTIAVEGMSPAAIAVQPR